MKTAKTLKIIGLLPVIFLALVYAIFGIGESVGKESGGWMHLIQFVLMVLVIWLCWKFPFWGGILLLCLALFRAIALIPELFQRTAGQVMNSSFVGLFVIPLISGGLFLAAGWIERKAKPAQTD